MKKQENRINSFKQIFGLLLPKNYANPVLYFGFLAIFIGLPLIVIFLYTNGFIYNHKDNVLQMYKQKKEKVREKKKALSDEMDKKEEDFNKMREPLLREKNNLETSTEEFFKARNIRGDFEIEEETKRELQRIEAIKYQFENNLELSKVEDIGLNKNMKNDYYFLREMGSCGNMIEMDVKSHKVSIDAQISMASKYEQEVKLLESLISLTQMQQSELNHKKDYIKRVRSKSRQERLDDILNNIARNAHKDKFLRQCLMVADKAIPLLIKYDYNYGHVGRLGNKPPYIPEAAMLQKYFGVAKEIDFTELLKFFDKATEHDKFTDATEKCLSKKNIKLKYRYIPIALRQELKNKYPKPDKNNITWSYRSYPKGIKGENHPATVPPDDLINYTSSKDYTKACFDKHDPCTKIVATETKRLKKNWKEHQRRCGEEAVKKRYYTYELTKQQKEDNKYCAIGMDEKEANNRWWYYPEAKIKRIKEYCERNRDNKKLARQIEACKSKMSQEEVLRERQRVFDILNSDEIIQCVKTNVMHNNNLEKIQHVKYWWE